MEEGDPVISTDPDDPTEPPLSRANTKKMARSIDIDFELSTAEDMANFFEHIAKLIRRYGKVKVTIE